MRTYRKQKAKLPSSREITIEKLATNGDGAATVEKKTWYIPYTQVGDIVKATPVKQTQEYIKAKVETFIQYTPHRQQPICPLFGECGGCKLQHLKSSQYQQWKIDQLITLLNRHQLSVDNLDETYFLSAYTRRRVTFSLHNKNQLSFNHYNSHKLIGISQCPLLKKEINNILPELQDWLNQYAFLLPNKTQIHLSLLNAIELTLLSDTFLPQSLIIPLTKLQNIKNIYRLCWKTSKETHVIWQKEPLFLDWGNLRIPIAPSSFLQASHEGEVFLQRKLSEYTKNAKSAVDLFCGIGTFSFIMAQNKCQTKAYDNAALSIQAARFALKNQTEQQGYLNFFERDLFRQPLLPNELKYDVIILDPPRAGAKETILQIAKSSSVEKIIMISCNPKSFARDMGILKKAGFYINRLSLLDQFTYSQHLEIIGEIIR